VQKQVRGGLRDRGELFWDLKYKKIIFKKEIDIFSDRSTTGTNKHRGSGKIKARKVSTPGSQLSHGRGRLRKANEPKKMGKRMQYSQVKVQQAIQAVKSKENYIGGGCQTLQGSNNHHL
jgi:hypothetical protein